MFILLYLFSSTIFPFLLFSKNIKKRISLFFSWLNFINLPFLSFFIYFLPQFFLFFFFITRTNLHANFSKNIKRRISLSFLFLINFINLPLFVILLYLFSSTIFPFLLFYRSKFFKEYKKKDLSLFFSWLNFINLPFLSFFIYFLPQFFLFFFFITRTNFSKNTKRRISLFSSLD